MRPAQRFSREAASEAERHLTAVDEGDPFTA